MASQRDSRDGIVEFDYDTLNIRGSTNFLGGVVYAASGTVGFSGPVTFSNTAGPTTWPRIYVIRYNSTAYVALANIDPWVSAANTVIDDGFTANPITTPSIPIASHVTINTTTGIHTIVAEGVFFLNATFLLGTNAGATSNYYMTIQYRSAPANPWVVLAATGSSRDLLAPTFSAMSIEAHKWMVPGSQFKVTFIATENNNITLDLSITKVR
jgi:hypothetical protein